MPDPMALLKSFGSMVTTFVSQGQPGPVISAHEWLALLDERAKRACGMQRVVQDIRCRADAPVRRSGVRTHRRRQTSTAACLRIDGADTPYAAQGAWSAFASFAGLPSTVAPVARSAEGLPIGVQIVGPFLHDRTTLAVASWLEAQRK